MNIIEGVICKSCIFLHGIFSGFKAERKLSWKDIGPQQIVPQAPGIVLPYGRQLSYWEREPFGENEGIENWGWPS